MVDGGFSRHIPVFGIAIALRRRLRSMQVRNRAYVGLIGFGAMNGVINRQKVPFGKLIHPLTNTPCPLRVSKVGPGELLPNPQNRVGFRSRWILLSNSRIASL